MSYINSFVSNNFVSLSYKFLFENLFHSIKIGKMFVEINDPNYQAYNTKGNDLVYGDCEVENLTAKMTITNLYRFSMKCLFGHDIGFAESFILGDFTVDDLKVLTKIQIFNQPEINANKSATLTFVNNKLKKFTYNFNKMLNENSRDNIKKHYNLSNELYSLLLGDTMVYTYGIYKEPMDTLSNAQFRKTKLLIDKLNLSPSDTLLEIGCGWGYLSCLAAKLTGCKVTAISISTNQIEYCIDYSIKQGVEELVDFVYLDYRDLCTVDNGVNIHKFDRVVSVGMLEHVGLDNISKYFNIVDQVMKPGGLLVLDFLTFKDKNFEQLNMTKKMDFVGTYIFEGDALPSITHILNASTSGSTLELKHLETNGTHYGKTLEDWQRNLMKNQNEIIDKLGFDQQFINTFNYYFSICAAALETGKINNVQMIYGHRLNTSSSNYKEILYNPKNE